MTRLQWIILVLTLTSLALVVVFPPWLEVVSEGDADAHSHPYCCFDTPIWERPAPTHAGETITLDRRRLGWQLTLVALPGFTLFVAAGWLGRRRGETVEESG